MMPGAVRITDDEPRVRRRVWFGDGVIVEPVAGIAAADFRGALDAPLKLAAQGFCPPPRR